MLEATSVPLLRDGTCSLSCSSACSQALGFSDAWHEGQANPLERPAMRLVMVQDDHQLQLLQHLCEWQADGGPQPQGRAAQCLRGLLLTKPSFRCRHTYHHTVRGVAGYFTEHHIELLHQCNLGQDMHVELDGRVHKAEGLKPASTATSRQLLAPDSPADGAADSVPLERQKELAELVGVASWEQLRQNALLLVLNGSHSVEPELLQQSAGDGIAAQGKMKSPANEAEPDMPAAPADLPDAAPGPAGKAIDQAALQALARVVDKPVSKVERLPPALWGLDRIDQKDIPLDGSYRYGSGNSAGTGAGVTIYALDSGIRRSHQEFQGWSSDNQNSRASCGYDIASGGSSCDDVDGHGTHVAATAIGRSVGVAKLAKLVSVRVLDGAGSGSISDTVAGLDWVAKHHQKPAIVMMSLGVEEGTWSRVLEQSVASLINDHGITVVVAAGNNGIDACDVSPASLPDVITVAASNLDNKFSRARDSEGPERMYSWSNTGRCVDLFAPGVEIWSACGSTSRCPVVSDDAYTWASGTSMAVPHVAGVAALYLSQHPTASPRQVSTALVKSATQGKIRDSRMIDDTPNRLLFSVLT